MLTQATNEQLIALAQLTQSPRWKDVDALIEAEIAALVDRMIANVEPHVLHEARGRIKALRELRDAVREAPSLVEKKGLQARL